MVNNVFDISYLSECDWLVCKHEFNKLDFTKGCNYKIRFIKPQNPHLNMDTYSITILDDKKREVLFYNFTWDGFTSFIWDYFYNKSEMRKLKLKEINEII